MSKYISTEQKSVLSTERGLFCLDCGKLHNGNNKVINDTKTLISVCDYCIERNGYEKCEDCSTLAVTYNDVFTGRKMSRIVCQKCIDDSQEIEKCMDCREYFDSNKCGFSGDGFSYCERCSENYGHCDGCGRVEHCDNLYYDGNSDHSFCESCLPKEIEDLHDYSYDPPCFNYYGDAVDGPHIGVELEIDDGHDGVDILTGYSEHYSNYYLKKDGSLSSNGIEIVTHPHTCQEMINLPWVSMFGKLVKSGYRSHDGDRCGLHFHVDRKWLDETGVKKCVYLCEKYQDDVFKLSRRTRETFDKWSSSYDSKDKARIDQLPEPSSRHKMVNIKPQNTIEFRFFRGTLKHSTFIASLQFIQNLAMIAKNEDCLAVESMSFRDIIDYNPAFSELKEYWGEKCA